MTDDQQEMAGVLFKEQHEELKPCPYCGSTAIKTWNDEDGVFLIDCSMCPVGVEDYTKSYEELKTVWNGLPRRGDHD